MRKYEENLSTEQAKEGQEARLPQENEYQIGEADPEEEKGKGAEEIGSLNRIRRIKREREIRSILRTGKRISRGLITISYLRGGREGVGFAFLVGKRVGKAVVRNRVKRRLREIARERSHILPSGVDLCIMAAQSAGAGSFQELEKEIVEIFEKLREYEENRS